MYWPPPRRPLPPPVLPAHQVGWKVCERKFRPPLGSGTAGCARGGGQTSIEALACQAPTARIAMEVTTRVRAAEGRARTRRATHPLRRCTPGAGCAVANHNSLRRRRRAPEFFAERPARANTRAGISRRQIPAPSKRESRNRHLRCRCDPHRGEPVSLAAGVRGIQLPRGSRDSAPWPVGAVGRRRARTRFACVALAGPGSACATARSAASRAPAIMAMLRTRKTCICPK